VKKIVLIVNDEKSRRVARDRLEFLSDDNDMQVTFEDIKTDRSTAQNRLMWVWIADCENTECNEHSGKTKNEWHRYFKQNDLMPIFVRDDEDYAQLITAISNVSNINNSAFDVMLDFIIDNTSTTKCSIKQFTEYLTEIERFCAEVGIMLRTDSHLYSRAMGVKS
jgi:hypothetical protein